MHQPNQKQLPGNKQKQLGSSTDYTSLHFQLPPPNDSSGLSGSTTYEMKWTNYSALMQNMFRRLLKTSTFTDVTLACEGYSIKCHRLLLAACSTYFEKIFYEQSGSSNVVFIKDMKISELKALVNYMYNGQVNVRGDQLSSFLKAAESFEIKEFELLKLPSSCTSIFVSSSGSETKKTSEIPERNSDQPKRKTVDKSSTSSSDHKRKKLSKSSWSHHCRGVDATDVDIIEFERFQLSQLFENENEHFGDVEDDMEKVEQSEQSDDENETEVEMEKDKQVERYVNDNDTNTNYAQMENDFQNEAEAEDGSEDPEYYEDEDVFNCLEKMEMNMVEFDQDNEEDEGQPSDGFGSSQLTGSDVERGELEINEEQHEQELIVSKISKRSRKSRTHEPGVQEAAITALRDGKSIRQCSELFGISRKTLAKWNHGESHSQPGRKHGPARLRSSRSRKGENFVDPVVRDQKLQQAAQMALSGITKKRAAAIFEIPRTTLSAYMKRQVTKNQSDTQ